MRASPADYKSALRPGFAAGRGLFAQKVERWRAHFLYGDRDGRAPGAPGSL